MVKKTCSSLPCRDSYIQNLVEFSRIYAHTHGYRVNLGKKLLARRALLWIPQPFMLIITHAFLFKDVPSFSMLALPCISSFYAILYKLKIISHQINDFHPTHTQKHSAYALLVLRGQITFLPTAFVMRTT